MVEDLTVLLRKCYALFFLDFALRNELLVVFPACSQRDSVAFAEVYEDFFGGLVAGFFLEHFLEFLDFFFGHFFPYLVSGAFVSHGFSFLGLIVFVSGLYVLVSRDLSSTSA